MNEAAAQPAGSFAVPRHRLRILHVITDLQIGGAENLLLQTVRYQKARGHTVAVCSLRPAGPLAPAIREVCPLFDVGMGHALTPLVIWRLARLMRRGRYDVAHGSLFQANLATRLAARLAGVPVNITSMHTIYSRFHWYHFLADRLTAWWADGITGVSDAVCRFAVEQEGLPAAKVRTLRSGLDLSRFQAISDYLVRRAAVRAALGYSPDDVVISITARLHEKKGHTYLFQAVERLRARYPQVRVLVIGDGPHRATLEAECRTRGLTDIVQFLGMRQDVPDLLAASDISALPTLLEGLGLAVLEAMAMRCPVVATGDGGVVEIIEDGVHGLLVPPADAVALASALERLITDGALRAALVEAGYQRVLADFSFERMMQETEALYDGYLVRKAPGRLIQPRVKVLHLITYFPIFHGAQENTCLTVNYHDKSRYEVWLGTQPGGSLLTSVQGDVHLALIPHLQRAVHPLKDLLAWWEIYRLCRRERFTIVHTHISKAGVLGRLAAWLARTPVILHTVHTISFQASERAWVNRLYLWLEKRCAPITSRFLVVSQLNIARHLEARIGKPEQYQVVYSGIDVERLGALRYGPETVRAQLGVPLDHRLVVWIGRLAYQKDPQCFVRAASALCREMGDVTCLMVGDGPLRAEVERLIDEQGMRGRIIVTGFRDDVPEILSSASVLGHSSRFEGMGRVISEALLLGVPVAGTAVDGVVEAIESGQRGGLLVPPEQPAQLAAALRRLLEDRALVKQLTSAGKSWAWARFDAREMVRHIEAIYVAELQRRGIPLPAAGALAVSSPAEAVTTPARE